MCVKVGQKLPHCRAIFGCQIRAHGKPLSCRPKFPQYHFNLGEELEARKLVIEFALNDRQHVRQPKLLGEYRNTGIPYQERQALGLLPLSRVKQPPVGVDTPTVVVDQCAEGVETYRRNLVHVRHSDDQRCRPVLINRSAKATQSCR